MQGAIVFAIAIPFNQFAAGAGADGRERHRHAHGGAASGFPRSRHQRLLAMFVRATKPGENTVVAGVSARRVVAFRFGR